MMNDINQRRRRSFDAVAHQYDQARPSYPAQLFDAIISFANLPADGRILEIGSGTGKATLPFAQRGYRMLCVELGENMAAVARAKLASYPQVELAVGDFNELPIPADAFDLVVSAQAFHWVDPDIALPKIATALHAGGSIALFWSILVAMEGVTPAGPADFIAAAHDVYQHHAPALAATYSTTSYSTVVREPSGQAIAKHAQFGPVTVQYFPWEADYSAEAYTELLATYSDHLTLDPARRADLIRDLIDLINTRFGGYITRKHVAVVYLAHRL